MIMKYVPSASDTPINDALVAELGEPLDILAIEHTAPGFNERLRIIDRLTEATIITENEHQQGIYHLQPEEAPQLIDWLTNWMQDQHDRHTHMQNIQNEQIAS